TPALSWALNYVDSYRREFLPANLIQGQRDFFGAHTYKRLDKEGIFHTEWAPVAPAPVVESEPDTTEDRAEVEEAGERSARGGEVPASADRRALHPEADTELEPDPEEEGERTPEATRKAKY
ncbi:MAG TPA: hypothetical protein VGR22_11690, partial [Thermomicrobiales bacterium]|nr:hypothetical protein [Thermomicrobiales bacterium]